MTRRTTTVLALMCCVVAGTLTAGAAPASAGALAPWWRLTSGSSPSYLPVGTGDIVVSAANLGDGDADGQASPVVLHDRLPRGVTAKRVAEAWAGGDTAGVGSGELPTPECKVESEGSLVACTLAADVLPYDQIEVTIEVEVAPGASATNGVSVSGGGAPSTSLRQPLTIGEGPTPFGVEHDELSLEEEGGAPDTRAGSHPFQFTTAIALDQSAFAETAGLPKDLNIKLPAGLIGNPNVFPRCTLAQFYTRVVECSPQTVMGVAMVTFVEPGVIGLQRWVTPVYNLEPNVGEPARFGFRPTSETPVLIDTSLRTGGDYGVTANVRNITQAVTFISSKVMLWGVPGEAIHDGARGAACLDEARGIHEEEVGSCHPLGEANPPPFVVTPTSCQRNPETGQPEPLGTSVEADSWERPGAFESFAGEPLPGMDNCDKLAFDPSIKVATGGTAASSPTGLSVDVHVNQESVTDANSLAESAVRDITVALPKGVAVNPAGGDGLEACSEPQVGFIGPGPAGSALRFTPTKPEPFCPDAAKIGTVEITSPLLPADQRVDGAVYLASQNANPFGSLVAMYIVAEDPTSGVLVKIPGEVRLSESGQVITTIEDSPQLAFEDAKLVFFGGERAPLASPAHCGVYTTEAAFVPWAAEPSDEAAVTAHASSAFDVTSGPNHSRCPGASLPFSPFLTAGSPNVNAGSFTSLTTTIGREDGEQNMQQVSLRFPPGLSGLLSSVTLCAEPQADEGTCPASSEIGETTVSAGVGSDPVSVTGGKVYITGPYDGAPFGLSIVNPVKAGPFNLEHDTSNPAQDPPCECLVVRGRVEVDPHTAALTVSTDESGPHAIPHEIDGIPVQIRKVNVLINRPGFTFNPTNCNSMRIEGEIKSDEGASSPVSVPLQVTNCAALKFEPKFEVFTSGKTSKADGASLIARVTEPNAPQGSQANIAKVKVELPLQLPSRLTTLQKACTQAQFAANPAGCPAPSVIGHAVVHTQLLPVPLEGPVYFVSNGGEAFPNLVMVLQGYGVTIDLVGDTFISKAGVTSTTFKSVPDAPFHSFEINLPEGPYSALAANGDLCGLTKTVTVKKKETVRVHGHGRKVTLKVKQTKSVTLALPNEFIAQDGAEIHRSTNIAVTGCAKAGSRGQAARKQTKRTHDKRRR